MINKIKSNIFQNTELNLEDSLELLKSFNHKNLTFADLYFQSIISESFYLNENIIKNCSYFNDIGVGVRAVYGEKTGFSYTNNLNKKSLQEAISTTQTIQKASINQKIQEINLKSKPIKNYYKNIDPLQFTDNHKKINFLKELNQYIHSLDNKITQVSLNLSASCSEFIILATDGTFQGDIRPIVRLSISILMSSGIKKQETYNTLGARCDYEYFIKSQLAFEAAKETVRQANVLLNAKEAPAGKMPVVLGNGWGGVLLHEAVGHGLEGDFNRKQTSIYSNKINQKIAGENITVIDDGTVTESIGTLNIDDEGTLSQKNILIKNGILKQYIQDKQNAYLMGMKKTGNGRRQSYCYLPIPRMTNTYLENGNFKKEEIIKSIKDGLYCATLGGGQVDITSGSFVFQMQEAYIIKNGELKEAVKGATLIGDGSFVMNNISMIGNDLKLNTGSGSCGKLGQSVPVGVGQPTVKIDSITVGGTKI